MSDKFTFPEGCQRGLIALGQTALEEFGAIPFLEKAVIIIAESLEVADVKITEYGSSGGPITKAQLKRGVKNDSPPPFKVGIARKDGDEKYGAIEIYPAGERTFQTHEIAFLQSAASIIGATMVRCNFENGL